MHMAPILKLAALCACIVAGGQPAPALGQSGTMVPLFQTQADVLRLAPDHPVAGWAF